MYDSIVSINQSIYHSCECTGKTCDCVGFCAGEKTVKKCVEGENLAGINALRPVVLQTIWNIHTYIVCIKICKIS